MYFFNISFLFVFILFLGNTTSFDYEYGDYEIISDDTTQENDLPIDLNNEELLKNKYFKNDTMEFFTRLKRQSAIFAKRLEESSFKNQQKDQFFHQPLQMKKKSNGKKFIKQRGKGITVKQRQKRLKNTRTKFNKKIRIQKTTTKVPESITTDILSESSNVQKGNFKMPIDDYDEYFANLKADHMVSLYLKKVDSEKVTFNNAIQENDLPTSLKSQESNQIYHFNNGKVESIARYKRQSRLSRGRQRSSRRSSQRRLSSSATRRARERDVQRRRRLISQRQEEIRRSQATGPISMPNKIQEVPKQEVPDIDSLLKDDAFINKLMDRFDQRMRERGPPRRPPPPRSDEVES
uniref:Uncharacterized protein n=2 Tax=Strongyloides stercoralis TaxID=6248 RepID=A0AAF5DSK7_STRER